MERLRIGLLLAAWVFAWTTSAQAQGKGNIAGRVARADGTGVGGVTVVLSELSLAELTQSNGGFSFKDVPEGSYTLHLTLGSHTSTKEAVGVGAGARTDVTIEVDWDVGFAETLTVLGASRRRERVVEAPAAVTSVSEEQIEREAAHGQLPKLLEFTPGAEVTQSGIYDFNFNTRGFNSSLNRRVATLVDGRDPSVPFLASQDWASVSYPLDDLAGIEFVRGPSAALYGANASSGVIAVTTKAPRDSQGGKVRLTGGELATFNADVRWAGELGRDWYAKVVGGYRASDDFVVSRRGAAEYSRPCTATVRADCLPQEAAPLGRDDNRIYFGGLRFDKHTAAGSVLTLEGGYSKIEGPVLQTGIGRVQVLEAERPWARASFSTEHWNVLGYYNRRDAPRQLALGAGTNLLLDENNLHLEAQGHWSFAKDKARIVVGGSWEKDEIDSFDKAVNAQTLIFEPVDANFEAVYAQLDWSLTDRLKLVVAGRWDGSSLYDSQVSPKGSLVYSFKPNHSLRLTYNEAFQVPNYSEFFLQANVAPPLQLQPFEAFCAPAGVSCGFAPGPTRVLALGNKDLDVEQVKMFEIGYSGIVAGKLFVTADYYNSRNEDFITDLLPQLGTALGRINDDFGPYAPPANLPAPLRAALLDALQRALGPSFALLSNSRDGRPILAAASYSNFGKVDTQGVDLGLRLYLKDHWNASLSYSWFDFEVAEQLPGFASLLVPNSPGNKLSAMLGYHDKRWDGSASVRWVEEFRWAVGPFQGDVPSYTVVDLNGNVRFGENWSVGVSVANLFDEEHWEAFGGDILGRRALANVAFGW